jgi:hypothetical protein
MMNACCEDDDEYNVEDEPDFDEDELGIDPEGEDDEE